MFGLGKKEPVKTMRFKPNKCDLCKKAFWYQGQLERHKEKKHGKSRTGWSCPKCHNKHYDVYASICPSCGLDFNSEEFNEIARNLK